MRSICPGSMADAHLTRYAAPPAVLSLTPPAMHDCTSTSTRTPALPLLYADQHLLVLNKPAELLSVPGRTEPDCLSSRVQAQFADALVVHRLDMATSGLMVMARGATMQRLLSQCFAQRQVHKRYIALVQGHLPADAVPLADMTDMPPAMAGMTDAPSTQAEPLATSGTSPPSPRWAQVDGPAAPSAHSSHSSHSVRSTLTNTLPPPPRHRPDSAISHPDTAPTMLADALIAPACIASDWQPIAAPLMVDWPCRPRSKIDWQQGKPSLTFWRAIHTPVRHPAVVTTNTSALHTTIDATIIPGSLYYQQTIADTPHPALESGWQRPSSAHTVVELSPWTGRSHQLRLHMQAIGHPIAGDTLYGDAANQATAPRLLLHAWAIEFTHPVTQRTMCWTCPTRFTL